MKGEKIRGFEGLGRWGFKQNHHLVDKGGRGYFCNCMPAMRFGERIKHPCSTRRKAYHNEQWFRQFVFERNRDDINERKHTNENL